MRASGWGADSLERFARSLRLPRRELRRLEDRLRSDGWSDAEVEPLRSLNLHEEVEAQYRQALLAASDIIGCLALEREGRDFR